MTLVKKAKRIPSSFRDNCGFLFSQDRVLYRQVNEVYKPSYEQLVNSGLYDYLVKEINHMLKTHYYAIDVFTNEYGRKNHMATIKYGKAESGPLAAKLNESLIFRAESFESETVDWTEADLFVDWLKDENIIFHELTNRTHKGQNYGAFRRWDELA